MVRATQKGEMENPSSEVAKVAATTSRSSVKKFAKTKHKGLPEKKVTKESFNEDYVKELEDGLVKMDYPTYDEVDKLMCKIAKENDIDTTTLHMAFKTKHLMVPDDWAKKKMFEPIMIPKTPKITGDVKEERGRKDLKVNPELLAAVRKKQKEVKAKQVNLDDKKNTPTDSGQFQKNKPVDAATRKRMSAPENQFNSFEPENSLVEKLTAKQRFKRDAGKIAKNVMKQKEHEKYVNFLPVGEAVNAAQQAAIAISKRKRLEDLKVAKKRKLKKEDYEPVINMNEDDGNYHMNKIAKERGLDLTDPRQRRRANSLARKNAAREMSITQRDFLKEKRERKYKLRVIYTIGSKDLSLKMVKAVG